MLKTHDSVWNQVLEQLQSKMNRQSFNSWLLNTKALQMDNNELTIIVPDETAKEHILKIYSDVINETVYSVCGNKVICNYMTEMDNESPENSATITEEPTEIRNNRQAPEKPLSQHIEFNPTYTFDTFIIGPNNELAHAAAESISKNPAGQYNPLFIYGDSGLGKTHLLQAIGNAILQEKPYLKVLYVTSEQFISEFIQAIQTNATQSLKIKYRNVDVLMIDDIQFLANKEQTQTEFFHTFNDLHVNKKQIVLTSDRPPRELSLLTDRLRTRFEGGLLADIKAPNLETREAILRKKANLINLELSDEIISYLAKRIKSNIRLLESALNKLHAIYTIKKMDITIDVVKQYLRPLFEEQPNKEITIDDIIVKVAKHFGISEDSIRSKSRHSSIIQPRFITMFLATRLTQLTTTEIGKLIGKRDHSTVINARNNIEKALENDEGLKEKIDDIISDLKS
ncbi:MAG: chromosomal replication initiator protein DnaA [Spirochaetes bacterium]|jgi:chromosomal replication initiator protein|nr:chromosomal replication initiator protein DnaA [Spirochaetota bacterium]